MPPEPKDAPSAPTATDWMRQVEQAKKTFYYVRNLAHDAWRDPPNLEAVCKRIEAYAQMQYDLLEALIAKYAGEHAGADKEKP